MMEKSWWYDFLFWASGWMKCHIIRPDGMPYLERYFVCQFMGITVYLHRFIGSDPGYELHNHPWNWAVSLMLFGWYIEERYDPLFQKRLYRIVQAPALVRLMGRDYHRVNMEAGLETWSLFIHGKWVKPWGFCKTVDIHEDFDNQVGVDIEFRPYPGSVNRTDELGDQWWRHNKSRREATREGGMYDNDRYGD